MNRKIYIASALAAALFIGCGGNSGACCNSGIKAGEQNSVVIDKFTTDKDGNMDGRGDITNENGDSSGSIVVTRGSSVNPSGEPDDHCTKPDNTCSIKVIQESHCPDKPLLEPVLRYTDCYGTSALKYAAKHAGDLSYDFTKQMIVYGGALLLQSDDFSTVDATLKIKGIKCGMEVRTGNPAGFSNPGAKVFALIKILDACGNDVKDSQWTKEVTMDENGNFVLDVDGLEFGNDNQVEILFFSVKDADVTGSTGISGASY